MSETPAKDDAERPAALAAVQHAGGGEIDRLMSRVAANLRRRGYRVGGVVQSNVMQPGQCRCDMLLEELGTGEVHQISQQLGPGSRGCRLDASLFENVVARVEASLREPLDIFIVNKFGKQEAEGRGLRQAIAEALAAGIPVLVGLNHDYAAAWRDFCGGDGDILAPDEASIGSWLESSLAAAPSPVDA